MDIETVRADSYDAHRCPGNRCSTCDFDADIGLGLTDLELDDEVYFSDSDFDDNQQQNSGCWYESQPCNLIVTRRDSGIGSITQLDNYRSHRRPVPHMGTKIIQRRASCTNSDDNSINVKLIFRTQTTQRIDNNQEQVMHADSADVPEKQISLFSPKDCIRRTSTTDLQEGDPADMNDIRWVVRRRSNGSRYITRRPAAGKNAMHSKSKRRRHQFASNDDMISQWRRLAAQLANYDGLNITPLADDLFALDENQFSSKSEKISMEVV